MHTHCGILEQLSQHLRVGRFDVVLVVLQHQLGFAEAQSAISDEGHHAFWHRRLPNGPRQAKLVFIIITITSGNDASCSTPRITKHGTGILLTDNHARYLSVLPTPRILHYFITFVTLSTPPRPRDDSVAYC